MLCLVQIVQRGIDAHIGIGIDRRGSRFTVVPLKSSLGLDIEVDRNGVLSECFEIGDEVIEAVIQRLFSADVKGVT